MPLFPVYAGVLLNVSTLYQNHWTFPRIRGGAPRRKLCHFHKEHFSPYTRGCSFPCFYLRFHRDIFPVYAGFLLSLDKITSTSFTFPRIRGGAPDKFLPDYVIHIFSPYTRGCSHVSMIVDYNYCLFPVYAGVLPLL